jgi:serine/threonine-protein kinase HipA
MPLRADPYPADVISPWLANLLPEEEQLQVVTRSLGLDQADVLAVLTEIGGDTAGALSFGAATDRELWAYVPLTTFYNTADPHQALERHFEDLGRRPFLVGEEGVRQSLAGGQKKTALAVLGPDGAPVLRLPQDDDVLAIPLNGAPSTLIVKPDNSNLPGITENEVWCLRMAQAVGIDAARATIIQSSKRTAIGVLRYDRRVGRSGHLLRLHQEDFAQANGLPPGRKYERGTLRGLDLKTLLETGRHVSATDALALLDQVIFNILVANTDAHAKNYSLILPVGGGPRLAPLYDVSTVLSWPHVVKTYAQSIDGKKRRPDTISGRHWEALAREVGYRPTDVKHRVQQIVDALVANRAKITDEVAALPGTSEGYVVQTAEAVEGNALRMAGRL